jgi:uncharacterized protein YyaL (SSP411 family)
MTGPDGGFYSAEDADSEGEEGKFYIWSKEEIIEVLGEDDGNFIAEIYNVFKDGNFAEEATGKSTGENILHLNKPLDEIARDKKISIDELNAKIEAARAKLFDVRKKRIHPYKDDKVLTDWNGFMIAAMARAGRAFNNDDYIKAAEKAVSFINAKLRRDDSSLLHRFRDGEAAIEAYLDDYAYLTYSLIELYQATFDEKYLLQADTLTSHTISKFLDEEAGGFFQTADDAEALIVRRKEVYDGAYASGNSIMLYNLLRLGKMLSKPEYEKLANDMTSAFAADVERMPIAHTQFLTALHFTINKPREVVIVGQKKAADTNAMLRALAEQHISNMIVVFKTEGEASAISWLAEYTTLEGKATAYVCENYQCQAPTNDTEKMLELLGAGDVK